MVYITQLIYIIPGKEAVFNDFEDVAIPIIAKYEGALLLRTTPGKVIAATIEVPHEIHLVSFPTMAHFERFKQDEGRKAFLHLKEASVRSVLMIVGE